MNTIGIIGAGEVGSQVARKAVASGYQVVLANSRGPHTLGQLLDELGPKARAATAAEAAEAGDFVVHIGTPTRHAHPARRIAMRCRSRATFPRR